MAVLALAAWVAGAAGAHGLPDAQRRSGFESMSPSTQAMQRDDDANPGMLSVRDGEARWARPDGAAGRACKDCHGDARISMRGAAARHPRWDETLGEAVGLSQRIALCRERHQRAPRGAPEGVERLSLSAYVAHASRGLPVQPDPDERLDAVRERGRRLFDRRMGQLDLSCADCHDARWGRRLGASTIPQGHTNGYPLYRLEWQSLGSLQRRLRNCMAGVRAEPWSADAPQWVEIEAFLQGRGAGLTMEAPAVRP